MPFTENGERSHVERQLVEAKRIAQEVGYELRFHPKDGPKEFQVIDCEFGEPVGVHWNADAKMWGVWANNQEKLFTTIAEALANKTVKTEDREDERELET